MSLYFATFAFICVGLSFFGNPAVYGGNPAVVYGCGLALLACSFIYARNKQFLVAFGVFYLAAMLALAEHFEWYK
jgi:hypothetical protein